MAMNPPLDPTKKPASQWLALVGWIALCFGAAALGAASTSADWYASLNQPAWSPPGWLFGPVWTALYTMMGVSAWMVWRRGGFAEQRRPLKLFLAQLALNAVWTPLFFGLRMPGLAFAEILLLWVAIAFTIAAFGRVHRPAAWLLVPYLAWVSFATVLNGTLWLMN